MTLDEVSYKQAKALNELGFPYSGKGKHYSNGTCDISVSRWNNIIWDWEELEPITEEGILFGEDGLNYEYNSDMCIFAPYLELVAKWLRRDKNINIYPIPASYNCLEKKTPSYFVGIWFGDNYEEDNTYYGSWERAMSAGIDKAIEKLKKDNLKMD